MSNEIPVSTVRFFSKAPTTEGPGPWVEHSVHVAIPTPNGLDDAAAAAIETAGNYARAEVARVLGDAGGLGLSMGTPAVEVPAPAYTQPVPQTAQEAVQVLQSHFPQAQVQQAPQAAPAAVSAPAGEVLCGVCNGKTWDNRTDKRSEKSPDYKCRDKQCGAAAWVRDGKLSDWRK